MGICLDMKFGCLDKYIKRRTDNMKKLVLAMALVLGMSFAALAADGWYNGIYIEPKLMYGFTDMDVRGNSTGTNVKGSDDDSVFGGGIAFGYDFKKRTNIPIRAEIEYALFSKAKGDFNKNGMSANAKMEIMTLFFNGYFDFHNSTRFTPFVGAGVGMSFIDTKGSVNGVSLGSNSETNFAWNGTVGVNFRILDNLSADLSYRFVGLGDGESKTSAGNMVETEDVYMHQGIVGLRYTF